MIELISSSNKPRLLFFCSTIGCNSQFISDEYYIDSYGKCFELCPKCDARICKKNVSEISWSEYREQKDQETLKRELKEKKKNAKSS